MMIINKFLVRLFLQDQSDLGLFCLHMFSCLINLVMALSEFIDGLFFPVFRNCTEPWRQWDTRLCPNSSSLLCLRTKKSYMVSDEMCNLDLSA